MPGLTFRLNTFLLAILLLAFASPVSLKAEATAPPNILLIMADDVGVDVIGCYGGEGYPTPNIDKLAGQGKRFEHCYSMPSCHPTRITLLTGKYPRNVGYPKWGSFPRNEEDTTIAARMKQAGYATAVAGKWQLSLLSKDLDQPHRMGFEEYCLFGWHEGPRYHQPLIFQNGEVRDDVANEYGPEVYTDFLIDFMAKKRDQPFFAYYPMALCHDVTDDLKEPVPYGSRGRYDSFAEMMSEMDRMIAKLMAALDRLKLEDNTIVLFTADNGTPFRSLIRTEGRKYIRDPVFANFKGRKIPGGKTELTNGGTRVPLIARWPGHIEPGTTSDTLVDFSDFLPTLLDLAGDEKLLGFLNPESNLQGLSFASQLGPEQELFIARRFAFSEGRNKTYWVRTQDWKLYSNGKFYHMAEDYFEENPLDTDNLANEEQESYDALKLFQQQIIK